MPSGFYEHCIYMVYKKSCRPNNHTHKIKTFMLRSIYNIGGVNVYLIKSQKVLFDLTFMMSQFCTDLIRSPQIM